MTIKILDIRHIKQSRVLKLSKSLSQAYVAFKSILSYKKRYQVTQSIRLSRGTQNINNIKKAVKKIWAIHVFQLTTNNSNLLGIISFFFNKYLGRRHIANKL